MSQVTIRPVTSKAEKLAFLRVPFDVYRDDPNWVPPLFLERLDHLNPKRNPYFKHADVQLFLAERDGKPVGRISAQVCQLHLARYGDATGQFGFLDAIDDREVFAALTAAATQWLQAKGMQRALGPFSFSINDEMGLLIDGFDSPPSLFMGHALPYFQRHIEQLGFTKAKDVIAYDYKLEAPLTPLIERAWRRAQKSNQITVRPLDKKKIDAEMQIVMSIFNDAWSGNWGYVPFTEDELKMLATNLKMLVTGDFVSIASVNGEPAAMAVTLPNINEWIVGMEGRLLPFNWARLLPKIIAKRPQTVRLPLMGVVRKYHDSAIGSALAFGVIMALRRYHLARGVKQVEFSWILEDNKGMRNIIETAGANAYKTYRIYEKTVG
jgi:hypothetical protein